MSVKLSGFVGRRRAGRLAGCVLVVALASAGTAGVAGSGAGAVAGATKATGTAVKVGVISNELGTSGSPDYGLGAEVAADYANASENGLAGHKVTLDICKVDETTATGTACANQFVQDGVVAVVVPVATSTEAIYNIVHGAGIPYVTGTLNSAAELSGAGAYSVAGGQPALLAATADEAKKQGIKKVGMLILEIPSLISAFQAAAKPFYDATGVQLVVKSIPIGVPDASPQVNAMKSEGVGAVITVVNASTCLSILKAGQALNITGPWWFQVSCADDASLATIDPSQFKKSRLFNLYDVVGSNTEAKTFRAAVKKYSPDVKEPNFAAVGYEATLALTRAMAGLKGAVTPASVNTQMQAAKNVVQPVGAGATLTCNGQAFGPNQPQWKNWCSAAALVGAYDNHVVKSYRTVDGAKVLASKSTK